MTEELIKDLKWWLECSRPDLIGRFITHTKPPLIHRGHGTNEFIYIPGTRKDKVLLIAHTDTVWDIHPNFPYAVKYEDGLFSSSVPRLGIGADDRAGCAMLWHLRHLGHSLLLTSGEENGCLSSHWIINHNHDIAKEIQKHQFLVQFDRSGASDFKCYTVGTPSFRKYLRETTKYEEPDQFSNTDIVVLAKKICGVNLSIGYYNQHTSREFLNFQEWRNTLNMTIRWLSASDLPRFKRPLREALSWRNISF